MITISLTQARSQLSELVERARRGEAITVTRHGKAVAKLVPADSGKVDDQRKTVQDAFRQLQGLSRTIHLEGDIKAVTRVGLD